MPLQQEDAMTLKAYRPQELAKQIVIIDGISSSGKSLIAPLLSSLDRGELWLLNHLYEYLCSMYEYGRIQKDAGETLIRMYADLDLYNLMIGRHTNFRPADQSGAFPNLLGARYRKRMGLPEGDRVTREIAKKKPILFLMTHYIFGSSKLLFSALQKRLSLYLIMGRHPVTLIQKWHEGDWHKRNGRDPREMQLCVSKKKRVVPWFAADWEKIYFKCHPLERSVRTVDYFVRSFDQRYRQMPLSEKKKVYWLPFEAFAAEPWGYLKEIAVKLKAKPTAATKQIMKKLGLPRTLDVDGMRRSADQMRGQIKRARLSPEVLGMFDEMVYDYESRSLQL
jgi:hypothetical protein